MRRYHLLAVSLCLLFLTQSAQAQVSYRGYYSRYGDPTDYSRYYTPYYQGYGIYDNPNLVREYQRRLRHYAAHQYPLTVDQHDLLHDDLEHERFHDALDLRRRYRHSTQEYVIPYPFYRWNR